VPAGAGLLEGAPLDHRRWRPDPAWREMLRHVVASAEEGPLPAPAAATLARLRALTAEELDAMGGAAIAAEPPDLAAAPFLAAALQAYYARLAGGLAPELVAASGGASCPVCASAPVAGTIAGDERVRHLACALCGTRWHATRVQCVRCQSAAKLSYFGVEELPGVLAETCEDCGVYVKLFDLEARPGSEPVADDAATLVLDLLLAERGYRRTGPNLVAPTGLAPQQRN
jgi:FdhE protein